MEEATIMLAVNSRSSKTTSLFSALICTGIILLNTITTTTTAFLPVSSPFHHHQCKLQHHQHEHYPVLSALYMSTNTDNNSSNNNINNSNSSNSKRRLKHTTNNKKGNNSKTTIWKQLEGSTVDASVCSLSADDIKSLIKDRNKARRSRNFELADSILHQLNQHNVQIDDERKVWRADRMVDVYNNQLLFTKDLDSKHYISEEDERDVTSKLEERAAAKALKNYDVADDILDELKFLYNVVVVDETRTWKVTEPFKQAVYVYGGKRLHNIPEDVLQTIEKLVKERAEAKRSKDYNTADAILEELREDYNVRIDDGKKAWYFTTTAAAAASGKGKHNNNNKNKGKKS